MILLEYHLQGGIQNGHRENDDRFFPNTRKGYLFINELPTIYHSGISRCVSGKSVPIRFYRRLFLLGLEKAESNEKVTAINEKGVISISEKVSILTDK